MLIAQLSVAGEGDVYPLPQHDESTDVDRTALDEFLAGQSNLPWVVFRAAHRASNFPALPTRARSVLAALARTVDANQPFAAIFARRELLTGRAMQSMRTFYRSLDDLEAAGLIERTAQKRYGTAGLFGRTYIHLTERSAIVLGYVSQPSTVIETIKSVTSDASQIAEPAQACELPCATVADGAIYKDLFPKNQKRQPGHVPADLERLLGLGFRQFLIFKLMREAKANAKLLSNVVEATWEHLQNAKRPISYLRALLRSPVDFGHQIRTKRNVVERKAREDAHEKTVNAAALECAGHTFIDRLNTKLITVSNDASFITVRDYRETTSRLSTAHWTASFVAALAAGELSYATADQIEGFRAKCQAAHQSARPSTELAADSIAPRTRTSNISDQLSAMKKTLRAACAGISPTRRAPFGNEGLKPGVAARG
jgi:hypothetical protein